MVTLTLHVSRHLLLSTTKLRRLCFYTCLSFCSQGGGLPQCMLGYHPPDQARPWTRHTPTRHTPQTRYLPHRADTSPPPPRTRHHPSDKAPPRPGTPQSRHPPRPGPPPREQTPARSRHPPADGYCCGRYASYWNAFLFVIDFDLCCYSDSRWLTRTISSLQI